jgi:L-lactate dehydrogenase complex protein LldG
MNSRSPEAREEILGRLNSALEQHSGDLFRESTGRALPNPPMTVFPAPVGEALVECFAKRLVELSGGCDVVRDREAVARRVAQRIRQWVPTVESGSIEVLSWEPSELPIAGLEQALAQQDITLFVPEALQDEGVRARAAALTVGVTGVTAAFASTGSVVLAPGPGRSRAAGLLPLNHLVLVPLSRLFTTFEAWLLELRRQGRLEAFVRASGQIVFVTGPSKSADIELNLTLGVHGPKVVHAIVFDDT